MNRSTIINGVCNKRDKITGDRIHSFRKTKDGNGNEYTSCEKCGVLLFDSGKVEVV